VRLLGCWLRLAAGAIAKDFDLAPSCVNDNADHCFVLKRLCCYCADFVEANELVVVHGTE